MKATFATPPRSRSVCGGAGAQHAWASCGAAAAPTVPLALRPRLSIPLPLPLPARRGRSRPLRLDAAAASGAAALGSTDGGQVSGAGGMWDALELLRGAVPPHWPHRAPALSRAGACSRSPTRTSSREGPRARRRCRRRPRPPRSRTCCPTSSASRCRSATSTGVWEQPSCACSSPRWQVRRWWAWARRVHGAAWCSRRHTHATWRLTARVGC